MSNHPVSTAIATLLLALSAVGELSTQLYVPALAEVARELGGGIAAAQGSLWVFLFGFGAGQLIFGPASDRFGRRPVLIVGLACYLIATAACLLVDTAAAFAATRFLQALGACACFVMARAIARDLYPLQRVPVVLATMTLTLALSVAVAPTLGGWLSGLWGWRANFVLLLGLGGGLLLAVLLLFRESNTSLSATPMSLHGLARSYGAMLREPGFLGYALPLSLVYGAMMAYVCAAPFVVRDLLDVSAQELGLIFGGILSGFITGILLSRLLVTRLGPDRLLGTGAFLVLAYALITAAGLFLWGFGWRSVVLPQFLLTLGAGFIFPNAVAGAIAPYGSRAGLAAALVGFMQMSTGALFGLGVGLVHDGSPQPMILLQLLAAVLAFLLFRSLGASASIPARSGP